MNLSIERGCGIAASGNKVARRTKQLSYELWSGFLF